MKKLSALDKLFFLLNSVAAALLIFSFVLPYLPPRTFAILSVLSLGVPLLILVNILFGIYWLLKMKRAVFLSLIVLIIGYRYVGSLYKFSGLKMEKNEGQLAVMSYNVRLFNVYDWIEKENIGSRIMDFITEENPDIICFQEFHDDPQAVHTAYPYKYEELSGQRMRHGQAIWSKYPFLSTGSIKFENTANNAIYADIITGNDTLRVYNVHLQSSRINPRAESLDQDGSTRLLKRMSETFEMQQDQAEKVLAHLKDAPYRTVVCGDFNNTAFSYVYKKLKQDFNDTFEYAGKGFGRTFFFRYFPVRIDFIFSHPELVIEGFKSYKIHLSDHYPIMTTLSLDR